MKRLLVLPAGVLALAAACCGIRREVAEWRGATMNTVWSAKAVIHGAVDEGQHRRIQARIEDLLACVNEQMSVFRRDSEVSRFNRYPGTGWFAVSAETAAVVDLSLRVSRQSGGAFDVTVAPLIDLWGFGPGRRQKAVPADEEIAAAQKRIGYRKLQARLDPPGLKKDAPDLVLNLSAVAKGHGVDRLAGLLETEGWRDYMVEIGGEIRTAGVNAAGEPWRIGIETPDPLLNRIERVIRVSGGSLATSGDYRNYFEKEGRRYSHTIDPASGRPIQHTLASVTVIRDSCAEADALATALNVLGPEKGYELARGLALPALFIIHRGEGFVERMTPEFRRYLFVP